jgi:Zinc-binding dehydrogenase
MAGPTSFGSSKNLPAPARARSGAPGRPSWFRQDLLAIFQLLQQKKIKPLIAQRFPLAEAARAHELLGKGGVTGKMVLVLGESSAYVTNHTRPTPYDASVPVVSVAVEPTLR